MDDPLIVAVINTSEDVAGLISGVLADEGFEPVVAYVPEFRTGRQDLADFLREHEPAAIVWDIAVPYDVNWQFVCDAQASGVLGDRPIVFTTTNVAALQDLIGTTPPRLIELIGRPFDLEEIVWAVRRAIGAAAGGR
jgi:DNA-binding response OmpR family regulator